VSFTEAFDRGVHASFTMPALQLLSVSKGGLGVRILVADDLGDTREVMRLFLERRGHEVIEAANGQEAVERAVQERPDFVLMDLDMPVMDGFHATRCLRSAGETAQIPIVAVSAHTPNEEWRTKAMECGFDEYYAKPLDLDDLEALLRVPQTLRNATPTDGAAQL
jgi:two-component system, cell cycle response regulator DivK